MGVIRVQTYVLTVADQVRKSNISTQVYGNSAMAFNIATVMLVVVILGVV